MFDWVNSTVLNSVMRYVFDKAGVAIIAHGYLNGSEWEQLSGIVISLAICVFSIVSAHTKHKALTLVGEGDAQAGLAIVKNKTT